jgi:hypothetical protein
MKQQSFSMMRLRQAELMILIWGSKGGENRQMAIWFKNLAQKRNRIKEPSQKGFDDGYEIMSRSIAFGSSIANSYAHSSNIASEQGTPNDDVNSDLTATSSQ